MSSTVTSPPPSGPPSPPVRFVSPVQTRTEAPTRDQTEDQNQAQADLISSLTRTLDGRWREVRERTRTQALELITPLPPGLDLTAHRAAVLDRLKQLAATGYAALGFPPEVGGQGDLGGSVTSFEMLGFGELSLMVKAGVQWGLFGGAVHALGTQRHHQAYLPAIISADLLGCFAMTETGHGSDVAHVRTTATYDRQRAEFVVHTPDAQARKDYIGNAARDGHLAVVFAQLVTGAPGAEPQSQGVHALLVPIRDENGHPMPGVSIEDDGVKAGLNGVDNGRLSFDQVRVPRSALLDRYGQVAPDGAYFSPIDNPGRRFFTMLGTLVRGRISVAGAADSAAQAALTIAVRYGDRRRQFERPAAGSSPAGSAGTGSAGNGSAGTGSAGTGSAGTGSAGMGSAGIGNAAATRQSEVPVLDYLAHQRLLLPLVARSYAIHFAQGELVADLHDVQSGRPDVIEQLGADAVAGVVGDGARDGVDEQRQRELETRAAGIKALSTWHTTRAIQTSREACGGAGYLAENRLPQLKADTDVFTTFEGDNTVLLQLVAKGLLTGYRDHVGDLDTLGMARFLAGQVLDSVAERTSARTVRDRLSSVVPGRDDADLLDRQWQRALFADREEHVLEGAARRLRRARGVDAFDVFNAAQDHVLRCATVHIERVLLEAFVAGIERGDEPAAGDVGREGSADSASTDQASAKELLSRLCDLFVLSTIEGDRAWFLEHGRLTIARSKAVVKAVDDLCRQLRPDAVTLVAGFGIPDQWLAARILQ